MKLTKKLMCLVLAGLLAVAQVPVMSIAGTAKTKTNSEYFRFKQKKITIESVKQVEKMDDLDSILEGDAVGPNVTWESNNPQLLSVGDNGKLELHIEKNDKDINKLVTITAKLGETYKSTPSNVSSPSESTPSEIECIATLDVKVNVKCGWHKEGENGKWRYYDRGSMLKSRLKSINGKFYFFGNEGYMETNKFRETPDGHMQYFGKDGAMKINSWCEINGEWYFFDEEGLMLTATLFTYKYKDGTTATYFFDDDGIMVTSKTIRLGDTYYMFNEKGELIKTWKKSSDNGSSDSGDSNGSGSSSSQNSVSTQSSGAVVTTNVTTGANGEIITTATISLGGKSISAVETVTKLADGSTVREYKVSGDVAGLTFAGVGAVSADGSTLTTPDGMTYPVTNATMMVTTKPDGTVVGYFVNPATGAPLATGADAVYMQIGLDGQMHAHFVNAQGFFYTGVVTLNGMKITFNDKGVMLSYEALA